MRITFTSGLLAIAMLSASASAAVIADIKLSKAPPEMVAEAIWEEPVWDKGTPKPPSAAPGAILWESSLTLTQRTATATQAFDISGELPAHVPAGALFTDWRNALGGQILCTQSAEEPSQPGKAKLAVCFAHGLNDDGSTAWGSAKVRPIGKRYDKSVPGKAAAIPLKPGFDPAANVKTRPWPSYANYFSYQQFSAKGGMLLSPSNIGVGMAVAQIRYGHRVVLAAVAGSNVTLEHRAFDLNEFTQPLAERKHNGSKNASVTVDLASGPQTVDIGTGRFTISRDGDGRIAVISEKPFDMNWTLDPATGRLLPDGVHPYVMGAQEIG